MWYFFSNDEFWFIILGVLEGKSEFVEEWSLKCFEDFYDFFCIIIISGRERFGDIFLRLVRVMLVLVIGIKGLVYKWCICIVIRRSGDVSVIGWVLVWVGVWVGKIDLIVSWLWFY